MIGSLRGTLLDRSLAGEALIEVNGVGYRVTMSPATLVALGETGDDVFVHVHHHVREDGQTLVGFRTLDDRICFEALLGAHGVGPALALAILSVHAPDALRRILADDDVGALCLVPGVGKKTAARLLLELKARLSVPEIDLAAPATAVGDERDARSGRADVRDALANLGYGPDEIRDALVALPDEDDPALLLRHALRHLGSGRVASLENTG
jgi:holliday junction DNA helicase RuvA